MPDEASAGLEEPLLEARQRPVLDGQRQGQPTEQIAEVIGDDSQEQADLVRAEAVAGETRPMGRGLALLDPLLRRPAPVVEVDDGPIGPGQRSHDEADPREQLAEVMLDLRDHVRGTGPGGSLIVEGPVAHQRRVTGPTSRPGEEILDGPAPAPGWPGVEWRTPRHAAPMP